MKKESNEENNHITSGALVAQRKRGRPRKLVNLGSNVQPLAPPPEFSSRTQQQPLAPPPGFSSRTQQQQQPLAPPPGFSPRIQQQPYQSDDDEAWVGQPVSGVIEATFEAGYLISVKVENSDSVLRGVVFKPGGCDPVSVDNDVAPDVPMIIRNIDASAEGGRKSSFQEKHGSDVRSKALVPVPTRPKILEDMVVPVPIQPARPTIPEHMVIHMPIQPARPTMPEHVAVPVVLQPANLQNGGKQVLVQHGPKQTETGSQVTGASDGNPYDYETLLTQMMKNDQEHYKAGSLQAEYEQALFMESLQAIHPVHQVYVPKPSASYGGNKMAELLEALQENVRETHSTQGQ